MDRFHDFKRTWKNDGEITIDGITAYVWTKGAVRVVVSRGKHIEYGIDWPRWHMSVSCKDRYPTWDEICEARHALLPDNCVMAQILPPTKEYVTLVPNCFQLYEIPVEAAA